MARKLTGRSVLVTGGAGFIGSNLCQRFLEQDNRVVCLDDLSTGHMRNILPLMENENFTFIKGDIRVVEVCREACKDVDVVMHQAALGSVPRSVQFPIPTHDVNSSGTLNMLDAARLNNVRRFVYASSSSVYGDEATLPKKEERVGRPLSPYAASKAVGEMYAKVYGQLYDMETIGLRYFNVFGKNQDPNGAYAAAIPKFIKAMINGAPVTIHGDGTQSRDFTYIENVIQANELAALTENPAAINQAFNVAYGEQFEIGFLVDKLNQSLTQFDEGIKADIQHIPMRPGDIKHSLADVSKARDLLGYAPSHSLQDGLENAIEWYWNFFHNEES